MAKTLNRWKEPKARFARTYVYLDEPQVVLLDHGLDAKIIGVAIDKPGYDLPFLGAEISFEQLQRYLREFVDLRFLLTFPEYEKWFIFDLAKMNSDKQVELIAAEKDDYKNEEFLPSHRFFARNHTEPSNELVTDALVNQRYGLDGRWEPSELSKFYNRVRDIYSLFLSMNKFFSEKTSPDQKKKIRDAYVEYPFRGGSSYVNFYKDLIAALGFYERLGMNAVQKASPGFLEVEGKADILGEVIVAFNTFQKNYEFLEEKYKFLHDYLSKADLLTTSPERFNQKGPLAKHIEANGQDLANLLGLNYQTLDDLTDNNPLSTAKILLSHHRRLRRYFIFVAEGRVQVPNDYVASSPSIDDLSGNSTPRL